jgi:hypothetical protein
MNVNTSMPLEFCFPQWFEEIHEEIKARINYRNGGLDHERHYKNIAFAQPYHAHGDALAIVLEICHKHGLKTYLNGASQHWPSRTFSIAIYRPEDEAQFQEYEFMHKIIGHFEQDRNEQPISTEAFDNPEIAECEEKDMTEEELKAEFDISEDEEVATIEQFMLEEGEAFSKAGNCPFTEDDLMYAAHLRKRMAMDEAFLTALRKGELPCKLDRKNFDDSKFLPGRKWEVVRRRDEETV